MAHEESQQDKVRQRYRQERDLSKITVIPAKPEIRPFDSGVRKRIAVYCRVSTDGVSQTTSFELQKKYYLHMVRQKPDWKLISLYADEGLTATSMEKRIGLLTMLEDARAGKFDIIVVKNLSRLSRNLRDCMQIIDELRALPQPVGILFETETLFTLDKSADFTLQVLSLVAQEESHKKSEAMNASYHQRFSQGQFVTPPVLGFDNDEDGNLVINEEEAKTVRLIFRMYLAGFSPKVIASVLTSLGRKTKTRKYKSGRIKEGRTNWTAADVLRILKNERACGDVLAQKTYTPNYLDHKSKKNDHVLPQFHAVDQHEKIVSREEFYLAQRLIKGNRGGWSYGIPQLGIYENGPYSGGVLAVPNWRGFDSEDYNRAALRAVGVEEAQLEELEQQIAAQTGTGDGDAEIPVTECQHRYFIDSDDYELFPDKDVEMEEEAAEEEEQPSFAGLIRSLMEKKPGQAKTEQIETAETEDFELVGAQMFSTREKLVFTMDKAGIYFGKRCLDKLDEIQCVELIYNPLEKMLIVRPSEQKKGATTLPWMRVREGKAMTRRCSCAGLAATVYENMGWNTDYKYRILGSTVQNGNETVLVFYLDEPTVLVPIAEEVQTTRGEVIHEREIPQDEGNFSEAEMQGAVGGMRAARSTAIYYGEQTPVSEGNVIAGDLGEKKYDPETIRKLLTRGLRPQEGWLYLKGMAVIRKRSFSILPVEWVNRFSSKSGRHRGERFRRQFMEQTGESKHIPYGWTVGLAVPTIAEIRQEIKSLRKSAV